MMMFNSRLDAVVVGRQLQDIPILRRDNLTQLMRLVGTKVDTACYLLDNLNLEDNIYVNFADTSYHMFS